MKIPLRFKVTEFDCATASLLNAFSYLFEREDIPAELVKAIHTFTLDCHEKEETSKEEGTSREAIEKFCSWITSFTAERQFDVKCTHLQKGDVNLDNLKNCLEREGVVFARCYQSREHYVIITDADEANAYIFDPYYLGEDHFDYDTEVGLIFDEPFKYNRIVKLSRLFSNTKRDFSLGKEDMRECVLIEKNLKIIYKKAQVCSFFLGCGML